jgi:Bacteriophage tail sheath protein
MPVNPTYPGVYIEELPSAVHTITGVPTSTAAFAGAAPRGPTDRPVHITSRADYERAFGGLDASSPMSYAVSQFYLNGGSEAEIVRIVAADAAATIDLGQGVVLEARQAGSPGNDLRARVDYNAADATLYTLTIHPGQGPDEAIADIKAGAAANDAGSLESKLSSAKLVKLNSKADKDPPASPPVAAGKGPFDDPALPKGSGGRNGAKPAVIRLLIDPKGDAKDDANVVILTARYPGAWGNKLRVRVDYQASDPAKFYNLTIRDTVTGAQERYLNIATGTADDPTGAHLLSNVLASSGLVTFTGDAPKRPAAHKDIPPGKDPFEDGHEGAWYTSAVDGSGTAGDPPDAGDYIGSELKKTGIYQLLKSDIFNMLCLPGVPDGVLDTALQLCVKRRAMLVVDPPDAWDSVDAVATAAATALPLTGDSTANAVIYFPNVYMQDTLLQSVRAFPPCGVAAGVWARTDTQRGVWKAPAGTSASLNGVTDLTVPMTDLDNGRLNPLGVNCLRAMPAVGPVSWGARTMRGADRLADQYKYLPVRRLALFIEESLYRGTQWVVFEPNDEPLWSSIRLNVGAFMHNLFREGAFQGARAQDAYLVKCDHENNPQNTIDLGIVNILVGFAPLKPAEFVIIQIQQLAGQIQV